MKGNDDMRTIKIMKTVRINEKYYIEVESLNLILRRVGIKNDVTLGYYAKWEHMFDRILDILAMDQMPKNEIINIQELKEIYISVKKEISSLIGNVEVLT